jgi:hypothetical protein
MPPIILLGLPHVFHPLTSSWNTKSGEINHARTNERERGKVHSKTEQHRSGSWNGKRASSQMMSLALPLPHNPLLYLLLSIYKIKKKKEKDTRGQMKEGEEKYTPG